MDSDLVKELLPRCIQYHKTQNTEHVMTVEGNELKECKEKATVLDENWEELGIEIMVHQRWIDHKAYAVHEVTVNNKVVEHKVKCEMSDDEIRDFQAEWNEKWKPGEEIEEIIENNPEKVAEKFGTVSGRQHFALPSIIPGRVRTTCQFFEDKC